jgi:hypothetical protein
MDVWFSWAKRPANCAYCKQPINTGEPSVVKKLWRRGNEDSRKINLTFHYHPECHYVEGLEYLTMNPYNPGEKRGPKVVGLCEEDYKRRLQLLQKKASLEQRKKKLKGSLPDHELRVAQINLDIMSLMAEIAQVGGIPKNWLR